jgi:hypothetical protein
MKKSLLFICFIYSLHFSNAQVRPTQPTVMVIPSDALLKELNCFKYIDNQGVKTPFPDYTSVFIEHPELKQVISKIGELFSDQGFALQDMEAALKQIRDEEAEDAVLQSRDGGDIAQSALDKVLIRAKPDIKLELTYSITPAGGPFRTVTFNIQAIDAYSNKQIASASGTGPNSTETIDSRLLEEAVLTYINNLQSQMQAHFDDLNKNGREVFVRVQVFEDAGFDLEEEFDDQELNEQITDWMKKNTVNGTYRQAKLTENEIRFSNVRIPMFNTEGYAITASDFARELISYLKTTFKVKSKNISQGIGDIRIVLKGKISEN